VVRYRAWRSCSFVGLSRDHLADRWRLASRVLGQRVEKSRSLCEPVQRGSEQIKAPPPKEWRHIYIHTHLRNARVRDRTDLRIPCAPPHRPHRGRNARTDVGALLRPIDTLTCELDRAHVPTHPAPARPDVLKLKVRAASAAANHGIVQAECPSNVVFHRHHHASKTAGERR
jgi:hypothetical protein